MDRRAFRFALRAATKVAFGGALMGCGANVVMVDEAELTEGDGGDGAGAGGADSAVYPSDGGAPSAPPPVCETPSEPPGGWAVYDAATFACCAERIADAAPADPAAPGSGWTFQTPDEPWIGDCCAQILAENYDAIWSQQPLVHPADSDVILACCMHQHGDAGCTPWGPPAPPAVDEDELWEIPTDPLPWAADAAGWLA